MSQKEVNRTQVLDMLVGQAHALQSIFMSLARRAANQDYLKQHETYLRMALKAQNQSRMTLETLAKIKNPPVIFAKQANINQGNGNQQVNNSTPAPASHAEKNINQQNELLEVQHGSETMDTRTTGATIGKIRQWHPWASSTGARTAEGKAGIITQRIQGRGESIAAGNGWVIA